MYQEGCPPGAISIGSVEVKTYDGVVRHRSIERPSVPNVVFFLSPRGGTYLDRIPASAGRS